MLVMTMKKKTMIGDDADDVGGCDDDNDNDNHDDDKDVNKKEEKCAKCNTYKY